MFCAGWIDGDDRLAQEWNNSPVRMAKPDMSQLRKQKSWKMKIGCLCCRFWFMLLVFFFFYNFCLQSVGSVFYWSTRRASVKKPGLPFKSKPKNFCEMMNVFLHISRLLEFYQRDSFHSSVSDFWPSEYDPLFGLLPPIPTLNCVMLLLL